MGDSRDGVKHHGREDGGGGVEGGGVGWGDGRQGLQGDGRGTVC